MNFVADRLANGTRFRALTVVDVFAREALAIEIEPRLKGEDVVATLDRIMDTRGRPTFMLADNGNESSGRILGIWVHHHEVRIDLGRPGKPMDNCYAATFNGWLRDECLNEHRFESLGPARQIMWLCGYPDRQERGGSPHRPSRPCASRGLPRATVR